MVSASFHVKKSHEDQQLRFALSVNGTMRFPAEARVTDEVSTSGKFEWPVCASGDFVFVELTVTAIDFSSGEYRVVHKEAILYPVYVESGRRFAKVHKRNHCCKRPFFCVE